MKPIYTQMGDLSFERNSFYSKAQMKWEYAYEFTPDHIFFKDIEAQGIDVFSFIQRTFIHSANQSNRHYMNNRYIHTEFESIGLLSISSYESWLRSIGTRARQDIRRSERRGVRVKSMEIEDNFLKEALIIYNETPKRQGRRYTGYGVNIENLRGKFLEPGTEVLGAYCENKLIGLLWTMPGDRVAQIGSFMHLTTERDKLPTIAMIASAVKNYYERGIQFIVYPTAFGLQPNLDRFRLRMKFMPYVLQRYYIPLTRRGHMSIRLHIHKPFQETVPRVIISTFRPITNFVSLLLPASIWNRIVEQ